MPRIAHFRWRPLTAAGLGAMVWSASMAVAQQPESGDAAAWWSIAPLPDLAAVPTGEHPIDHFVRAELRRRGLEPAPPAEPQTMLRRLCYDLCGLPPTPGQTDQFVTGAIDYDGFVDQLLGDITHAERWARHWLDVVHYADTHGFDKDKPRPHAWRYRDWVIGALHEDLPYAEFVVQQLAGDVAPGADGKPRPDGAVATGFIAAGPWDFVGHAELREDTRDKAITRSLDRDDMVRATMSTFASTTVHCARCHDHVRDPIPQRDYYALQAVFAGVERADREYLPAAEATASPALVYAAAAEFRPIDQFQPPAGMRPIFVLHRGDVDQPREPAVPGALSVFAHLGHHFDDLPADDEGARRLALARWLVDRDNPLTWRSIVNRVWHHHFGRGLVSTPNDFGRLGAMPVHPELLDWLAVWFRDSAGGSLRALHRLIVTSATYRQGSMDRAECAAVDADNTLLWRAPRRRLDAEAIHDAILAVSDRLDRTPGGPPDRRFVFEDDHSPRYHYEAFVGDPAATCRRAVYREVVRSVPDPFFAVLDFPDSAELTPVRSESLTANQALALFNDRFVLRHAEHFAVRLERDASSIPAQVELGFVLALGRTPAAAERDALVEHVHRYGLASACRVLFNLDEFLFVD